MSLSAMTHLNFAGDAREALEYYRTVFGGQVVIRTYAQSGVPHDAADSDTAVFDPVAADSPDADHVSFGMLMSPSGFRIAAYDVYGAGRGHGLRRTRGTAGLASASTHGVTRVATLTHTEALFILLNGDTRDDIAGPWDSLAADGTVIQNLAPSAMSPVYGMLTDRYGVTWIFGATS